MKSSSITIKYNDYFLFGQKRTFNVKLEPVFQQFRSYPKIIIIDVVEFDRYNDNTKKEKYIEELFFIE